MRRYWITLLLVASPLFASDQLSPAAASALQSSAATARQAAISPAPANTKAAALIGLTNQESLAEPVVLEPKPVQQTFHIGGHLRDVISQVCMAYGVTALFDESVATQQVRLDLDRATWPVAMLVITRLTKTFWTPISIHQALFAADTTENRHRLEQVFLRTFYFSEFTTPQTLNEIVTALRAMLELRSVTTDLDANSISIRADAETLDAVVRLLQGLKDGPPQVVLDVGVFQVSGSFTRSFGVTLPTEFQVFFIPTASTAVAIAQSIVQQGSATLNNLSIGTRQLALTLPSASFGASQSQSNIRTLDQVTLRANQGEPAVLKIGEKYPILTSSYSSISSNSSFQPPPPSFSFVDIGFNLKTTSTVHYDGTVAIQLELHLTALGTQTSTGLPEILSSDFTGFVSAKDGSPIVAAGNVMQSTSHTRSGWPLLGAIPVLGHLFSNVSKQVNDDQLLIIITPHIVSSGRSRGNPESFVFRSAR